MDNNVLFTLYCTYNIQITSILFFLATSQGPQTRGPHVAARAFCADRDAFWKFSYNQDSSYLVYSPVFKSSQPESEQVPFSKERRDG